MASMTINQAKPLIRKAYLLWAKLLKDSNNKELKFMFFGFLQQTQSKLLDFDYEEVDQWQCINTMLSDL